MALHYILDGYNIIKCVDSMADCSLEQGRNALLRMINCERPQGSSRNSVTVVFDGRDDVWGPQSGGIAKVVFTSGQSADDYIKAAVESLSDRANIVVVSNDKEITCYVRKLGAKVLGVEKFVSFLHSAGGSDVQRRGRARKIQKTQKVIDSAVALKINKEFEKIWLDKQ